MMYTNSKFTVARKKFSFRSKTVTNTALVLCNINFNLFRILKLHWLSGKMFYTSVPVCSLNIFTFRFFNNFSNYILIYKSLCSGFREVLRIHNSQEGWNKRGRGAKVAKLVNVEVGINQ